MTTIERLNKVSELLEAGQLDSEPTELEEAGGRQAKISAAAQDELARGHSAGSVKLQADMFDALAKNVSKMIGEGRIPPGAKKALEAAAEGIKVANRAAYSARFILNSIVQHPKGKNVDLANDPELAKNVSKLMKAAKVLPPE